MLLKLAVAVALLATAIAVPISTIPAEHGDCPHHALAAIFNIPPRPPFFQSP
jgi:hypothetical protein